ncbi:MULTISPECIES: MFS transporter [Streptomyces]|uniref:MFS transporter n=1 Tax=Streptomyces TaxID=1883 RepID=UPI00292F92B4|nr:MFS transporter [Streptomyces sp. NEAU-HV9]
MGDSERRGRRRLRSLMVDTTAFRKSRDYRLLLIGGVFSRIGSQMTTVALPLQMYRFSGSPWQVGLLGLAEFVPFAVLSLFGGAISDRYDRRHVLIASQAVMAAVIATLAVATGTGVASPGLLYVLAAGTGAASAFDGPVRQALLVQAVPKEYMRSAVSLSYGIVQATLVLGPALGGFSVAWFGFAPVYAVDALTFAVLIVSVAMVRHRAPAQPVSGRPSVLGSLAESIRFVRRERAVLGSFGIDLIAMTFGMPRALFPVLALHVYHVGPEGTGLMLSAVSFGALAAALTTGWLGRARRLGRVVVGAVLIWGAAIAVAGAMPNFPAALVCLAAAGAADSVSAVCRSTIVQTITSDEMRGRMSAMFVLVVGSGPYLGDAEAGGIGSLFSPRVSVVSGGLVSMAGALLIAVTCPQLYRFDSEDYAQRDEAAKADGDDPPGASGERRAHSARKGKSSLAEPVEVADQ